jgi:hypothetical protein
MDEEYNMFADFDDAEKEILENVWYEKAAIERQRREASLRGGFRYGMKIPKRRTLRSKMKTHRLKSKKKRNKKMRKGSRKKRRRKRTAKK